jgi:glycosyltransferase involved in cell wall biosynthesis
MNQESPRLNFQSAEPYIKLAAFWQSKGKPLLAISNYEKALEQQSNYVPAYLELIHLWVKLNQVEQAIEVCRRAIEQNADQVWPSFLLDDCLLKQGGFTEPEIQIKQISDCYWSTFSRRSTTEPLRILLYTDCPDTYGAEQVNHALMCRLAVNGYKVTCVQSRASNPLIDLRTHLGIEHIWLQGDARRFPYTLSNVLEVIEIFSQSLPDLVIFGDGDPLSNLGANRTAMCLGLPYIRIVHCVMPKLLNQFSTYLHLLPNIYKAAKAVVSVSAANLQLMRECFGLPQHLGRVIYNGRPDEYFKDRDRALRQQLRQSLGIPQDAIVCFTSARIDPSKGYQYQLSAIEHLQKTPLWSQLYFVWAGTGQIEAQIKERVIQINAEDRIKFLGTRTDIPDLLDVADIFLLPSEVEGMPLSVMEAMAKGLPIAATAISGIPEELGETGQLLPDPNLDPEATVRSLVETIQTWAVDADLRDRIGRASRERAVRMFREEQMLECYVKLIQGVICSLSTSG